MTTLVDLYPLKEGGPSWRILHHVKNTDRQKCPQILDSTSSGISHGYQAAISEVAKS